MTSTRIAERVAKKAHSGQTDNQGEPYISHVERVAAAVSPLARDIAWLHDVVEDCPRWPPSALLAEGVPKSVVNAVRILTRPPSLEYCLYIESIAESGSVLAVEVKIADLRDNLRPGCPESLRRRYKKALARLENV